jgi:DNA-binding response OmpR family regulator
VTEQGRERILVVDDDVDIARFVEMNLAMEGFEVIVAHDGASAIELVHAKSPDLVILRPDDAGADGVEVTRRLRADAMTSATPIIMLTAKGQTVDKVLGLTAGADDYVVKPFDTLELVARVRGTLRRNQEFREVSPLTGCPATSASCARWATGCAWASRSRCATAISMDSKRSMTRTASRGATSSSSRWGASSSPPSPRPTPRPSWATSVATTSS